MNGNINLDFCRNYLKKFEDFKIICTDGAYEKIHSCDFLSSKIEKVIGDFDSATYIESSLFLRDENQYKTDFEKALDFLIKKESLNVIVFGSSGGEMDHFLSNMSIAKKYKDSLNLRFVDEFSEYYFIQNTFKINDVNNKMFSIVPFPFAKNIYYKGLKYGLSGESLILGESTGVRNHAVENTVEINYSEGDILLFISHDFYRQIRK
ncbi:thiamine diphosphokinase [Pseudofrancisella aestuarii]|uniref:Thiamine diphosphokinase n=1 Tax=Pseudofrancisella aestuarii TaxID=2670347 RepID=A0ABV9TBV1_9GAMM